MATLHELCELGEMPVSLATLAYWARQDRTALLSAWKLVHETSGCEEWVFIADEAHFEQFACEVDRGVLARMTPEQRRALVGHWE